MKLSSIYTVLMTQDVRTLSRFYTDHFDFELTFESDWYVSMKVMGGEGTFQLAILDANNSSIPEGFGVPSRGTILNIEVEDVTPMYQKLIRDTGLPVHLEMRDEAWGQRHFITADPDGNLIDVIQIIEPTEEFLAQYTRGLQ
jgi:catechol 2,3-dioxygenase-like lactoylglutathione lyase family enzyme